MRMKPVALLAASAVIVLIGLTGWRSRRTDPAAAMSHATAARNAWFEDRAAAAGVRFTLGHNGRTPLTIFETIGTGCAVLDYDGDGWPDIVLVGQKGTVNGGRCALYHNNGDGTFADVTRGSGLEEPGLYTGCAVGDVDNDGRPDIVVTGFGVVRLYRNQGHGRFKDVTAGSGVEAPSSQSWGSSAGFFDYDRDGRPDLYVGRYVVFNQHTLQYCDYGNHKSACGPMFYDPQIGSLYHNVGGFRFEDTTRQTGLSATHGKCLGIAFADLNGDGWPDMVIANDEMPGDLFINDRGKRFRNVALEAGTALDEAGRFMGGMGVDFGDWDHSGRMGMIVSTFEHEPTNIWTNTGGLAFRNRSSQTGVADVTQPWVRFGTKFIDVDNDGWLDVAVACGHIHDDEHMIDAMSHYRQPMMLLMNNGGKAFVDHAADAGPGFTTPMVGRGLVVSDFDNDGRQDILVSDLEGSARLLMNRAPGTGHWLSIALLGRQGKSIALGARVSAVAGSRTWISQCTAAGSYFSSSDPRVHFGFGSVGRVDRLEIEWPDGRKSVVPDPGVDRLIRVVEP